MKDEEKRSICEIAECKLKNSKKAIDIPLLMC